MKHNPTFLADEDLVRTFVAREPELLELLDVLRSSADGGSQHLLVLGGRGMGKTLLVRRLIAEVRRDPELSGRWFPLPFGEESYEVGSEGELWLAALEHLSELVPSEARWRESWMRLRAERDDQRLAAAALSRLLDFADEQQRRLLLVVENVDQLFGGQLSTSDAWAIRRTLQGESRILLLATAVRPFEGVEQPDQALFELFQRLELEPLDTEACGAVWSGVVGEPIDRGRARVIQILTGGNPRLVVLLASFAGGRDLRVLLDDLAGLVDAHTDAFKSDIEALAPKLRKVFLALAELWAPATARQVAEAARLGVSEVSAMLGRLVEQGRVTIVRTQGKTHHYQVAERLFGLYYLMRRRGGPEGRVAALMDFMAHFYASTERPREALCQDPDPLERRQGRGRLRSRSDRAREVLDTLVPTFREPERVRSTLEAVQDDLIALAAQGLGREILEALPGTPAAPLLEPLRVALRLELGEIVDAPVEVLEVASDVIARIHQEEEHSSTAPQSRPGSSRPGP